MKKRMKMKKYAEGGMSDDDEGYEDSLNSWVRSKLPQEKIKDMSAKRIPDYIKGAGAVLSGTLARPVAGAMDEVKKYRKERKNRKAQEESGPYKHGGSVKSSASRRADGIAQRGKTKGRMI